MSSERLEQLRVSGDVPRHVAIIMDGNGRWARERGLPRHLGHREGMKAVREAIEGAIEAGVRVLTLFAFSTENWKRPPLEISALMSLLQAYARKEREELVRQGVEVQVLGDLSRVDSTTRAAVDTIGFSRLATRASNGGLASTASYDPTNSVHVATAQSAGSFRSACPHREMNAGSSMSS